MTRWTRILVGVALLAAGSAWAQIGRTPTLMEVTEKGMFVLRNGTFAKLDAQTLKPVGDPLDLLGPAPVAPADPRDQAAMLAYRTELAKRQQTPIWLLADNEALIFAGGKFFRIDTEKMTVTVKTDIALPQTQPFGAQPVLKLADKTLFILTDAKILAVKIEDGTVAANADLPAAMVPAPRVPGGAGNPGGGVPVTPQPTSMVGVIVNHPELEGGFWTVKLDNGDEYVLAGAQLEQLLATPQVEGKRARLTGAVSRRAGVAMYGKGYFEMTAFQILPDAVDAAG